MTSDGVFYPSKNAADMHEHRLVIEKYCVTHTPKPINTVLFLGVIEALADPIRKYLDARQALHEEVRSHHEDTSTSDRDQTDQTDGDALDAAMVEQSAGGSEHMPEMGVSPPSKSVSERREKHGFRSWGDNA
jgi:hypothetical protein